MVFVYCEVVMSIVILEVLVWYLFFVLGESFMCIVIFMVLFLVSLFLKRCISVLLSFLRDFLV